MVMLDWVIFVVVLTVPGFFLSLAFFPKRESINYLERFILSVVFSMSSIALLLVLENKLLLIPINAVTAWLNLLIVVLFGLIIFSMRVGSIKTPSFMKKHFSKIKKSEAMFSNYLK